MMPKKKILVLAVNPKNTRSLRLDEEVREIEEGLRRAKKRSRFTLEQKWAVRSHDVRRALLDHKPQIIHFAGHGAGKEGLCLEDEAGLTKLVTGQALADLFGLFKSIECVLLNACYSEMQTKEIAKYIGHVIGMRHQLRDKAAIAFATGFYDGLGAGESIEFAYKLGCNAIQLVGIPEHSIPVLITEDKILFGANDGSNQQPISDVFRDEEGQNNTSEKVTVTLTVDYDFDQYSPEKRAHLLRAISELLKIDGELKLVDMRR